jgi:hypothetical protein
MMTVRFDSSAEVMVDGILAQSHSGAAFRDRIPVAFLPITGVPLRKEMSRPAASDDIAPFLVNHCPSGNTQTFKL